MFQKLKHTMFFRNRNGPFLYLITKIFMQLSKIISYLLTIIELFMTVIEWSPYFIKTIFAFTLIIFLKRVNHCNKFFFYFDLLSLILIFKAFFIISYKFNFYGLYFFVWKKSLLTLFKYLFTCIHKLIHNSSLSKT